MTRILVVEDEERIARFVELELTHEGYDVDKATDGRAGLDLALAGDYDLILLDVLLPGLNGMEVLRRLRKAKETPIILLTARDAVMDKVAGLDAGADDYITKPFAIEELLARIRLALRRHETPAHPASPAVGAGVSAGAAQGDGPVFAPAPARLSLDVERREVRALGHLVELTNREFEVLRVLLERVGVVVSRERLATEALGYEFVGETNNVDVHIAHLRAKLAAAGCDSNLISTVRGVGYVIREV